MQGLIREKCFIYYLYFSVDLDVNNFENILLSMNFYTLLAWKKTDVRKGMLRKGMKFTKKGILFVV